MTRPSHDDGGGTAEAPAAARRSVRTAWRLIRRFWPVLRPHRRYVVLMGVFLVLGIPLALASPQIVKEVINAATRGGDASTFKTGIALLIAMSLASVVFGLVVGWASTLFRAKVLRDVRLRLYLHLQKLSLGYHQATETGRLMSRLTDDVGNLGGVMADAFVSAGVEGVKASGYLVMVFLLEWRMALAGCAFVLVIFAIQYLVSGPLRRRSREAREAWAAVGEALHQSLTGHFLVQATASERHEARRFARTLHESIRARLRQDLFGHFTGHLMFLVGGVGPVLIILIGVYLIAAGELSVGGLFAFFMYLVQMFGAVGEIARLNPAMQSSLASLERIFEVLDAEPAIRSPAGGAVLPAIRGEVAFEGVGFSYDGRTPVLEDVTFSARPGQVVALVGPSGAGKSTLVHLVPRFHDVTAGRILIDGHDLRTLDLAFLRRQIGIVPQDVFLFARTIGENVAYGSAGASPEAVRAAAEAANAAGFILATPRGFDTVVGERGVRLSGGQRQRLAIAREILRDPRILILDEATSSLDSEAEALIQQALERLFVGRTSFVVAHRLSTVMRADLILVLDRGRIVERGTHAELLARRGLYHRLYETQFRRHEAAGSGGSLP